MSEVPKQTVEELIAEALVLQKVLNARLEFLISLTQTMAVDTSNISAGVSIIGREVLQTGIRNMRILEAVMKSRGITLDFPYVGEVDGILKKPEE